MPNRFLIAGCLLLLILAPATSHAILVRPAFTASVGNSAVSAAEREYWDWFHVDGGSALGGELLIGSSAKLMFGLVYNRWNLQVTGDSDRASQTDLDLCVRIGGTEDSSVDFFASIRAGYSTMKRWHGVSTPPPGPESNRQEFTGHGFGLGFVGGPTFDVGVAQIELSAGIRFVKFWEFETEDGAGPALSKESGFQGQLRIAVAVPFGEAR